MSEAKPFASLSPTLLARKGAAKPAMRPQYQPLSAYSTEVPPPPDGDHLEDLGWNDMGETEVDATPGSIVVPFGAPDEQLHQAPLSGGVPEVVRQQDALANQVTPETADTAASFEPSPLIPLAKHRYARGLAKQEAAKQEAAKQEAAQQTGASAAPRDRQSALASGRRAAFTLRVDDVRHLKLRLACTIQGRSAQQLVTQALDRLLDDLPELDDLAKRVRRR